MEHVVLCLHVCTSCKHVHFCCKLMDVVFEGSLKWSSEEVQFSASFFTPGGCSEIHTNTEPKEPKEPLC